MSKATCVLLVDDNLMDIELAIEAFRSVSFPSQIEVANGGQQALDYLLGHGAYANRERYPLPTLILLDLKMPGIDGFDVLRRLKLTPSLKRIPVIILTSSREKGDLASAYDMGANSYLVKPVSFAKFIEIVRQIQDYWLALNVSPPLQP